jgi:hypothetical protein
MDMKRFFAAAGCWALLPLPLSARATPAQSLDLLSLPRTKRLVISRLQGPVVFDGRSDEAAWKDVLPFPFVMQAPTFGGPPSERTEVLFAYDD